MKNLKWFLMVVGMIGLPLVVEFNPVAPGEGSAVGAVVVTIIFGAVVGFVVGAVIEKK